MLQSRESQRVRHDLATEQLKKKGFPRAAACGYLKLWAASTLSGDSWGPNAGRLWHPPPDGIDALPLPKGPVLY